MNKSELINAIADQADLTNAGATRVVDAFTDTITATLKKGEQVVLAGFGTFATSERAACTGRNPQTGEPLEIAAATLPKFKAGKMLKEAVNAD